MKKTHQYLGFLMLLPFIAWTITGLFFFIKPGYKSAYESLPIKTYPMNRIKNVEFNDVDEIRYLRSILGVHLLVKKDSQWQQLNPDSLQLIETPSAHQMTQLINDAIKANPLRYGKIDQVEGQKISTSTGISINLNWSEMRLYQSGADTDFINWMYKVHYLQWTGIKVIDKYLGIIGLSIILVLAFLGVLMSFKRYKEK